MQSVLVGHSFIRRLRDTIFTPASKQRRGGRGQDVHHVQDRRASTCAKRLGVDKNIDYVYTSSNLINFIDDLHTANSTIDQVRPQIVLIDIGSNDVAQLHTVAPNATLSLANRVFEFAQSLNLPLVIINAILPRTSNIHSSAEIFRQNAANYNHALATICSSTDTIRYNKMRGFHYYYDHNDQQQHRPVTHWSTDGIHCDTELSKKQYRNRIRHAILDNIHIARRQHRYRRHF